jgi:hypothetical protein
MRSKVKEGSIVAIAKTLKVVEAGVAFSAGLLELKAKAGACSFYPRSDKSQLD